MNALSHSIDSGVGGENSIPRCLCISRRIRSSSFSIFRTTTPCARKTHNAIAPKICERKRKAAHPALQAVKNQITPSPARLAMTYELIVRVMALRPF
jgi:hypothetical protein